MDEAILQKQWHGTVTQHLPHHPKVKGSSPVTAAGSGREIKGENYDKKWTNGGGKVVHHSPHCAKARVQVQPLPLAMGG